MALSDLQCQRLDEKLAARRGGPPSLWYLQSPEGASELAGLIDAILVQRTELFRDESQLRALREQVLEPMRERMRRPLRVWSAGCATGEEVASLLVLLAESGADPSSTVLGTDISESAIARARELSFSAEQLQRVPVSLRERWFTSAPGERSSLVASLRGQARFLVHNLMDQPYPTAAEGQGFDVIVCRNVLIYFTPKSFSRVVESLAERLAPEGMLMLSAAEPLLNTPPGLRTVRHEQAFFYARSQGESAEVAPVPPARAEREVRTERLAEGILEADALFAQVLEWAASGGESPRTTEALRRCLSLDPDLAAARYLLGMLLEQRGARGEAAGEYRRALRSLEQGRARATPFFLNNARLQVACARAVERVEKASGPVSPR